MSIKQLNVIILIIIVSFMCISCNNNEEMPIVNMIIDNKEYSAIITSYNWKPLDKDKRVSGMLPYDRLKDEEPISITQNKVIRLEFSQIPEYYFVVIYNNDNGNYDQIELKDDDSITVPEKPGVYYYGITTTWKEGQIIYGFCVKIE